MRTIDGPARADRPAHPPARHRRRRLPRDPRRRVGHRRGRPQRRRQLEPGPGGVGRHGRRRVPAGARVPVPDGTRRLPDRGALGSSSTRPTSSAPIAWSSAAGRPAPTWLPSRSCGCATRTTRPGAFRGANLVFGCYDLGMTPTQRVSHDALVIPHIDPRAVLRLLPARPRRRRSGATRSTPRSTPTWPACRPRCSPSARSTRCSTTRCSWPPGGEAAGNEAELAVYPESIHGFVAFPTEMGRQAVADITRFVDERIHAD